MTDKEGKTGYEYNTLNQLLHLENSIKTQGFSYDGRGNLTQITENGKTKNTYEFSPINRLTKATNADGIIANYDYNGLSFRVGKQITDEINPTKNIGYILDITKQYHNLLQMSDNDSTQTYTWDYNVAFADDNAYLQDELGSPLRYLDATGTTIDSYGYDEFGGDLYGNQGLSQPFGYTGYTADNVSGTYFAQAREYRAEVGRFVSEDLIKGTISFADTLNPYIYCLNSPLGLVDLDGREPVPIPQPTPSQEPNPTPLPGLSPQYQEEYYKNGIGKYITHSGIITENFNEFNWRLNATSNLLKSNDSMRGFIGGIGKYSVVNANGKIGIGNDDVSAYLKGVGDFLTAQAQAGIQYKDGIGLAAGLKASAISGRGTVMFDVFDWEIEIGLTGHLFSFGAEAMIGYFPEDGFTAKAGYSAWVGLDYLLRVKPPQFIFDCQ